MAETERDLIRRYLEDAIAAERGFETQLRNLAGEGDDEEVQSTFATHAEETRTQYERLAARLKELGGETSTGKSLLGDVLNLTPKMAQAGHVQEERTAQNLIMAFTVETGECAMYEALATVARASGDTITEALARAIQAEERKTAEKVWHFIPTRSKIALNMLTVTEVDPSVETRTGEDRIMQDFPGQ